MEPWQARLIGEKAELSGRIELLSDFMDSPKRAELSTEEQLLLDMQLSTMKALEAILCSRMAFYKLDKLGEK